MNACSSAAGIALCERNSTLTAFKVGTSDDHLNTEIACSFNHFVAVHIETIVGKDSADIGHLNGMAHDSCR